MSAPEKKKVSKHDSIVADVVKELKPEIDKAVTNKIAPISDQLARMQEYLTAEFKEIKKPVTAPSAPSQISVGGQTIDLNNLAGEIKKVMPNLDINQLQGALGGMQSGTAPNAAGGGVATPPAAPLTLTMPNGQQQQVNLGGLQQLMGILQMFGIAPNQQQQQGAPSWINEAVQREILDDLAFGSSIKRAVSMKIAKGVGDMAAMDNYLNFNNTMVQSPLSQITKTVTAQQQQAAAQGQNAGS